MNILEIESQAPPQRTWLTHIGYVNGTIFLATSTKGHEEYEEYWVEAQLCRAEGESLKPGYETYTGSLFIESPYKTWDRMLLRSVHKGKISSPSLEDAQSYMERVLETGLGHYNKLFAQQRQRGAECH